MPAKPKPVKVAKKNKKVSPYCHCRYVTVSKLDYKICAKCKKPISEKDLRDVLEKVLDSAVRDIVLLRDGCCVCPAPERGHSTIRQPGHLIKRSKRTVRWDLRNVNEQCSYCNGRHNDWANYYEAWFAGKFGADERVSLENDANNHDKYSIEDLEEMLSQLRLIYAYQLGDKSFKPRFSQKQILTGEWRTLRGFEVMTSYKLDNFAGAEAV